jgi:hypothetical protein
MPPRSRLVVCPECACHAKPQETHCPSCGARLRGRDGWVAPAAAIVAMGLTAVTCADDETETTDGSQQVTSSQESSSIVAGYTHSQTIGGAGGVGGAGGDDAGGGGAAGAGGN